MPTPKKQVSERTGKVSWRVQYRNDDRKLTSRSFPTRKLANAFIRDRDLQSNRAQGRSEAADVTLADALVRYRRYHLPNLPEHKWERQACLRLADYEIAKVMLDDLNLRDAHKHVMFREKTVGPSSIIREFTVMRNVLKKCQKWYGLENPWVGLELPSAAAPRSRLISDEEEAAMAMAVSIDLDDPDTDLASANERAVAGFLFACTTALRLGEICGLTFEMVNLNDNVLHLPDGLCKKGKGASKGKGRDAVITAQARKILAKLAYRSGDPSALVFGLDSGTMGTLFRRVRNRAFEDDGDLFTFHDSRHLGITRLARTGIPVVALARIVGHRDLNMLMVYYEEPSANIAAAVNVEQSLSQQGRDLKRLMATSGLSKEEVLAELLTGEDGW